MPAIATKIAHEHITDELLKNHIGYGATVFKEGIVVPFSRYSGNLMYDPKLKEYYIRLNAKEQQNHERETEDLNDGIFLVIHRISKTGKKKQIWYDF